MKATKRAPMIAAHVSMLAWLGCAPAALPAHDAIQDPATAMNASSASTSITTYPARWIASLESPSYCVPVDDGSGHWDAAPLFTHTQSANGASPSITPSPLTFYCAFTLSPSDAGARTSTPGPQLGGHGTSELESVTVSSLEPFAYPKGGAKEPSVSASIEHDPDFWKALEATAIAEWDVPTSYFTRPRKNAQTRIAFIDNHGSLGDEVGSNPYPHGAIVARIARELACSHDSTGADCRADVHHYLGLPLRSPTQVDFSNGGYFGSPAQVAVAIWEAVNDWLGTAPAGRAPASRLILNMSIGWLDLPENAIESKAVVRVLGWARCLGAVVVAAAGNAVLRDDAQPLLPAGYESLPAPTRDECSAYGVAAADGATSIDTYTPLVFAVAGTDATDAPLATTRKRGRPRLAAYAHAVSLGTSGGLAPNTPVLSGSSVAAAVVSGLAAVLWNEEPDASGTRILNHIYDSAIPLVSNGGPIPADFFLAAHGGNLGMRRVSLCRALNQSSPTLAPSCATIPAGAGKAPKDELLTIGRRHDGTSFPQTHVASMSAPLSNVRTTVTNPSGGPQPSSGSCPTCGVRFLPESQALFLDAALSEHALQSTSMLLTTYSGGTPTSYAIAPTGPTFSTQLPGAVGPADSATVTFGYSDPTSSGTTIYETEQIAYP